MFNNLAIVNVAHIATIEIYDPILLCNVMKVVICNDKIDTLWFNLVREFTPCFEQDKTCLVQSSRGLTAKCVTSRISKDHFPWVLLPRGLCHVSLK